MRFSRFFATYIVVLATVGLSSKAAESPFNGEEFGNFFEGGISFAKKPEKRNLRSASGKRRLSHRVVVGNPAVCNSDYDDIATAVDAVCSGTISSDTILDLCEDTFAETVDIDQDCEVKIRGQGIGKTIIKPDSGLFIVNAGAGNVKLELDDVTLDGANLAAGVATDALAGVVCEFSCVANITKVEVTNIVNTLNGRSFDIFASTTTDEEDGNAIEVVRSEFPNIASVGIFVNGPGTTGKIRKNTLTKRDPPINSRVIGIQVGRQAISTRVKENSLSGFGGTVNASTAINVFCAGLGTDIKKNTITTSDAAVNLLGSSLVDVEENTISASGVGIRFEYNPILPIDPIECESIDVENNRAKDNIITNCLSGVELLSQTTLANTVLNDNTVKTNHITGSIEGIVLRSGSGNSFTYNTIKHSSENGVLIEGGEGNVFKYNNIDQSLLNGFAVSGGDENIIKRNEIDNSGKNGILLFQDGTNPPSMMSDFIKNEIEDSAEYGIKVEAGFNNIFKRNKPQDSGVAAIMGINGVIPPAAPANGNQYIDNHVGADSSSASSD